MTIRATFKVGYTYGQQLNAPANTSSQFGIHFLLTLLFSNLVQVVVSQVPTCTFTGFVSILLWTTFLGPIPSLGILAAKLSGSKTVVFTDHDPGCINLLRNNVAMNSLSTIIDPNAVALPACHVFNFEWGSDVSQLGALVQDLGYDLILGSDLLYSVDIVPLLLQSVRELLRAHVGTFILVSSFDTGEVGYNVTICILCLF